VYDFNMAKARPVFILDFWSHRLRFVSCPSLYQVTASNIALYSVEGKPTRSVPGTNDMLPVQWSVNGHSVFTTVPDEIPARILRIDLTSGRQELVRRFSYRQTSTFPKDCTESTAGEAAAVLSARQHTGIGAVVYQNQRS
jgi:hypothetical protein